MTRAIAMIIELTLCVCALWALLFLSVLFHEAGHALGYRIATGDGHWRIRVGWGKNLLDTKRLTVNLLPFDGCFSPSAKDRINTAAKRIAILAGGPAASLLLAVGLLPFKLGGVSFRPEVIAPSAMEALINAALAMNLGILVMSLIPAHYFFGEVKGLETDGLQIIRALKDRGA